MGTQKHLRQIEQLFEKSPVVSFDSIERIIQSKQKSTYAKLLVLNLIRQGKIRRLTKGCYTKHNDISLAVFCFQPAYLGLQSASSLHGLWEQETIPIILTTKKTRVGIRQVLGSNVLVRRISKNYYFGQKLYPEGRFYLPYSDLEKTLIDLVVFKEKIPLDVLKKLQKRIDLKLLKLYLGRYSPEIRQRVLKLVAVKKSN